MAQCERMALLCFSSLIKWSATHQDYAHGCPKTLSQLNIGLFCISVVVPYSYENNDRIH